MFQYSLKKYPVSVLSTLHVHGLYYSTYTQIVLTKYTQSVLLFVKGKLQPASIPRLHLFETYQTRSSTPDSAGPCSV